MVFSILAFLAAVCSAGDWTSADRRFELPLPADQSDFLVRPAGAGEYLDDPTSLALLACRRRAPNLPPGPEYRCESKTFANGLSVYYRRGYPEICPEDGGAKCDGRNDWLRMFFSLSDGATYEADVLIGTGAGDHAREAQAALAVLGGLRELPTATRAAPPKCGRGSRPVARTIPAAGSWACEEIIVVPRVIYARGEDTLQPFHRVNRCPPGTFLAREDKPERGDFFCHPGKDAAMMRFWAVQRGVAVRVKSCPAGTVPLRRRQAFKSSDYDCGTL